MRRVCGQSMAKAVNDGDFLVGIGLNKFLKIKIGDVIELAHPELGPIVKRVINYNDEFVWIKGDSQFSISTEHIGKVSRNHIVAKLFWRISPHGMQRI